MKLRMVFCSCCKVQSVADQPGWSAIRAEQPDVLVLLGDNVYLDHDHHSDPDKLRSELRSLYARQFAEPHFARLITDLRAAGKPVFAIYDDHDFLGNNRYGGEHDPVLRETARAELIAAFDPPRTGSDVYSATRIQDMLLLVLDERFYRTAPSASKTNRDAILGAAQWLWLEQQLANTSAPYVAIASSTTYHKFADESWEQYPAAFERLRALIGNRAGALLLSGDIHRNESYDDSGVLELVSSGIARHGVVFGGLRENYAILDFEDEGVDVNFHGHKRRDQMQFRIPLSQWSL